MKKTARRFLSMLLALSMVFGMLVFPVSATENEESAAPVEAAEDAAPAAETTEEAEPASQEDTEAPVVSVSGGPFNYSSWAESASITLNSAPVPEDVEVDENAPEIIAVTDELKGITVLNADGESVPLTPGQIQAVLAYYQRYLDILSDNRNIYGIQTPFFLNFNDEGEDGLGILGEMLVLAGYSVEDVRAGNYAYMDLVMMIKTFTYTYGLGAEYYGNAILNGQKEALQAVEDSGAKTEAQKLLALNAWLAQNNTFDMPYIMNTDKDENGTIDDDEKIMAAPNGSPKNENYEMVQAYVEDDLTTFFTDMFKGEIKAGFEADLRKSVFEGYIKSIYAEGILTKMIADEKIREKAATDYVEQQIWQDAYDEYLENHCTHESVTYKFTYNQAEDGQVTATATMTCKTCGTVYTDPECVINKEIKTPATCTQEGEAVYTATAHFKNAEGTEIASKVDQETYTGVLPVDKENGHTVPTTAVFTWNGTETEAESATATCSACGKEFTASKEESTVKTEETDRKNATCGDGYVKLKAEATFTINDKPVELAEEKTVVLPGSGEHNYNTDGECSVCGHVQTDDPESEQTSDPESEENSGTGTDVIVAAEAQTVLGADAETAANTEATTVVHTFDGTVTLNESEDQIKEDAEAAADKALEDAREDGTVAQNVSALSEEEVDELTEVLVRGGVKDSDEDKATETDYEKDANQQAKAFVEDEDNQKAISDDPAGFLKNMLVQGGAPEEQADAIVAQAENQAAALIEQAATEGIEVARDENGNHIIMKTGEIVDQTMASKKIVDMDGDGEGDTTPNDAIPMYVQGATPGLTDATINGWKGCHIGAFGFGTSVCLGYAMAYTYLIQCMHPEVYGTSADADMTVTDNWKTREKVYGEDLETSDYLVDTVRVTFDTEVTMFGPDNSSNFGEVHYWNAVKVDGQWYYIDPCYVDVYVEVMPRDRVETDGNMNHLYFMFSHTSAVDMYDGYTNTSFGDDSSGITSLYANKATDKSYEDSWISRINCVPYFADGYAYYVYDSTDMLTILEESEDNPSEVDSDAVYKLVRHQLTENDTKDGDEDYFTLITFNAEDSDGELEARVYDPEGKETVRNELLTELVKRHNTYAGVYPSVEITSVLYGGKLYFNLANCILSLDLETYEVALVKEYNTVYGVRDDNVDFGGRAFSVVSNGTEGAFTVENHPIAALSLKDGELTVSIATNFALISGKKDRTNPAIALEDGTKNGYGYAYEESNFNPKYNTYFNSDEGEQYGYKKEINDNDEFMWSANFVEKLNMSHLAGDSHSYEAVTVAAFCDMDGFTENRCTTCGAIEADSRVTDEGTAHEHHYVKFDEVYYTKDDSGSWNKGTSYVCAMCSYAVAKPTEPGSYADEEEQQEYEDKLAEYEAAAESAGHTYIPDEEDENTVWADDNTSVTFKKLKCSNVCPTRKPYLDALLGDDSISVDLKESATAQAEVVDHEGDCATGAIAVYAASGEAEGYAYTATKKVQQEAGKHSYTGTFYWTEVKDEDGNPTGEYTATADVTCGVCGDSHEGMEAVVTLDEENSTEPSCTVEGKKVYVATVTVTDDEGNEIGSASDIKEVTMEKLGHQFNEDGICEVCGAGDIRRIYGHNRYETALAIAEELKEERGVETFDTILVANGGDFPDALAGSYLAMQKSAPILLTENKANSTTNGTILDYIKENLRSDGMVYILGGTGSVPKAFADGLEEAGFAFQRLAGGNRYETALKILEIAGLNGNEILVCSGQGYADALSVSAVNKPVLLVNGQSTKLSDAQKKYLDALDGDYTFYIVGGIGTVSEELEEVFKTYGTVERVAGGNRHTTSVAVAEKFYPNADFATLAPSMNFADGLCGGPLAYMLGAPLLLVSANNEAGAAKYVEERNIEKGVVFGGSYWIPDDSVRTVFGLDEDATIG